MARTNSSFALIFYCFLSSTGRFVIGSLSYGENSDAQCHLKVFSTYLFVTASIGTVLVLLSLIFKIASVAIQEKDKCFHLCGHCGSVICVSYFWIWQLLVFIGILVLNTWGCVVLSYDYDAAHNEIKEFETAKTAEVCNSKELRISFLIVLILDWIAGLLLYVYIVFSILMSVCEGFDRFTMH